MARWLNGAASLDWLIEHGEWFNWADICVVATEQAIAEKQNLGL